MGHSADELTVLMMEVPLTLMSSRGQKKFAEKLRFYPQNTQKGGFYIGQLESLS
jgi:hypothetical protein